MLSYLERWIAKGLPPYRIVRHLLSLFAYQRAARLWKRSLSECTWAPETAVAALQEAMHLVPDEVLAGVIAPFPMSYAACCPGCATCALSS